MTPSHYVPPESGVPSSSQQSATTHISSSSDIAAPSVSPATIVNTDRSMRPPVPPFPDQDRRPTTAPAIIRPIPHRPLSGSGRGQVSARGSGFVSPSTSNPNMVDAFGYTDSRSRGEVPRYSMPSQPRNPPPGAYMDITEKPMVGAGRRHSFPRHLQRNAFDTQGLSAQVTATSTSVDSSVLATNTASSTPPSRPPLPADGSTTTVEGFQTDYTRPTPLHMRRPALIASMEIGDERPVGSWGAIGTDPSISIPAPPTEAYLILRQRREPEGGWPPIPREEGSDWSVRLTSIQEPQVGLALGDKSMKEATPRLDPPLVIQIELVQAGGQVVPDNNAILEKKLAYMPLHLSLISSENEGDRDLIRPAAAHVLLDSDSGSGSSGSLTGSGSGSECGSGIGSDSESNTSAQLSLVGPTFGSAKSATVSGRRGRFFVFSDLRVRPSGIFRIQAKLLNVLGGTSTGITPVTDVIIASSFEVYTDEHLPGVGLPTALTTSLIGQGVLKPRSGDWGGESSSDGSD